jgi:hypothetical protein
MIWINTMSIPFMMINLYTCNSHHDKKVEKISVPLSNQELMMAADVSLNETSMP